MGRREAWWVKKGEYEEKMVRRCEKSARKEGRIWDRVTRPGCVSVERVATGQINVTIISVTPKSRLLKGPHRGRREEQDEGGIACGMHPFYRGHHQYTTAQMCRHTLIF